MYPSCDWMITHKSLEDTTKSRDQSAITMAEGGKGQNLDAQSSAIYHENNMVHWQIGCANMLNCFAVAYSHKQM